MPEPTDRAADLKALQCLITEAHLLLDTIELPEGRSARAKELLASAVALSDRLIETSPAAALGQRGGMRTAERGPEYYRQIAAKRKTRAGGRPKKDGAR